MTIITITISIDAGEDARVRVETPTIGAPAYVPPFQDELVPLPDGAIPLPSDPTPFRGMARTPIGGCPIHHEPWKEVPAGISKKTGRPYDAFSACPVRGCDQRPAA